MVTEATGRKREELLDFIGRKLAPQPAVRAVVGIGSIANGRARADSDIDAFVFLDPFDLYLVPAESIWRPEDDTFHSIMGDAEGIQLDFHRIDLPRWRDPAFEWPEPTRAELAAGWVAFDRSGEVSELISLRTAYPEGVRQSILDDAIPLVRDHLEPDVVARCWDTLGPVVAGDRLQAVYEYLVKALFAYNRRWRTWRNREMSALLDLPWLPSDQLQAVAISSGHDRTAYLERADALRRWADRLVDQLVADGTYGADTPDFEAFVRAHDEPGRAWNMDEWNAEHARRRAADEAAQ
jgi:predicted nucleotidyltransferase